MADHKVATGLSLTKPQSDDFQCVGCVLGKGHRAPIPKKVTNKSSQLLELVHSDVNGPIEVPSQGGSRYFVTFIDDFSRWTTVYTMKQKSETFECFQKFHSYAEKHTGQKVKTVNIIQKTKKSLEQVKALRTDNGGEYISNKLRSIFPNMASTINSPSHTLRSKTE